MINLLNEYSSNRADKSFKELLEVLYPFVEKTTLAVLKRNNINVSEAEEYVSIAMLSVADKIKVMKNNYDKNFKRYLYTFVRRVVFKIIEDKREMNEREISLDHINKGFNSIMEKGLIDTSIEDLEERMDLDNKRKYLLNIMSGLTFHQRQFILMYFGFTKGYPMSMEEVAKETGYSKMFVSKGVTSGLKRMRKIINNKHRKIFCEDSEGKREKWKYSYRK